VMKFEGSAPIYLQIIEKLKADIVTGKIRGGDKLPSLRDFAENYKVNPNTVQRVFMELEREGITYSQRGIGTFISEDNGLIEKLKTTQAEKYSKRFTEEMTELGLKKEEIIEYVKSVMEGRK